VGGSGGGVDGCCRVVRGGVNARRDIRFLSGYVKLCKTTLA